MNSFKQFVAGKLASFDSTIEGFGSLFLSRLSYKSTGIIFMVLIFVFFEAVFPKLSFAFNQHSSNINLTSPIQPKTKSLFTEKSYIKSQELKFASKTQVDLTLKPGEIKVLQPGSNGEKIIQTKVVLYAGQEYSRENFLIKEKNPIVEIRAVGVDPSEQTLETPYGVIKYKTKLNVWATSYDSRCNGCNQTTSIGLKAGYGVVAVDPKVIPLRSKIYIPGYGIAVAGDTGGSIKSNKIDLGFDDLSNSSWTARFTDIYILF